MNVVLTFKIKESEKINQKEQEKEKTIQLYNTLLNSLSHELRTPISVILGSIDTLQENDEQLSSTNKKVLFREIELASLRLNRQVENLLNMSRIEAGILKPKMELIEVNSLIFSVIDQIKKEVHSHQFNIETDEKLSFYLFDRVFLEQIIRNLVYNAIQHSPENSTIFIETKLEIDGCNVFIYDEGKGFPFQEIEFVFNRFYRIDQSKSGGTGLGLSIVKEYVEAMGGTVKLANRAEGGAFFTLFFPLNHELPETENA